MCPILSCAHFIVSHASCEWNTVACGSSGERKPCSACNESAITDLETSIACARHSTPVLSINQIRAVPLSLDNYSSHFAQGECRRFCVSSSRLKRTLTDMCINPTFRRGASRSCTPDHNDRYFNFGLALQRQLGVSLCRGDGVHCSQALG